MMPWGRVDDSFYDHPKLDRLGSLRLPAIGLYWLAVSWSNRYLTDGHIPDDRVRRLGAQNRHASALVDAGLWHNAVMDCDSPDCPPPGGDDWRIHDFFAFNKSREQVTKERSDKSEAGRLGGLNSGRSRREAEPQAEPKQGASLPVELPSRPVHSRPDHSRPEPSRARSKNGATEESDEDRQVRITRLLAVVNDPTKSNDLRHAAHDELNRLGWVA